MNVQRWQKVNKIFVYSLLVTSCTTTTPISKTSSTSTTKTPTEQAVDLVERGDFVNAEILLNSMNSSGRKELENYQILSVVLEGLDRTAKRLELVNNGLSHYPNDAILRIEKAYVLLDLGKYDDSIVWFDKAVEVRQDPRFILSSILGRLSVYQSTKNQAGIDREITAAEHIIPDIKSTLKHRELISLRPKPILPNAHGKFGTHPSWERRFEAILREQTNATMD